MKNKKLLSALGAMAGAAAVVAPLACMVSCTPTVAPTITLDNDSLEISKGDYKLLTASLDPKDAGELLWETDKSGIITLEDGESQFQKKVVVSQTAETEQKATITVSLKGHSEVAPVTCTVTVLPAPIQWSAVSKQGKISWQDNKIKAQLQSDEEITADLFNTIDIEWKFSEDSQIPGGQFYLKKFTQDDDKTIINIEATILPGTMVTNGENASFDIVMSYEKEGYDFETTIDGFVWTYEESSEAMIVDKTKPCHIYTNGKTLHIPFELTTPIEKEDRKNLTAKVALNDPMATKQKDLFVWADDGESLTKGEYYCQFNQLPTRDDTIDVRFTNKGVFQQTFKDIQMDQVALTTTFDATETEKTGTFGNDHTISFEIACTSHEVSEYVTDWFDTVTPTITFTSASQVKKLDGKPSIAWNEKHTILTVTMTLDYDEEYTEETHAIFNLKLTYENYAVDKGTWSTTGFDYQFSAE